MQTISTKVPADLKERIEEEKEEGETRSAAVRRMVRTQIEGNQHTDREEARTMTLGFGVLFVALYVFASTDAVVTVSAVYILLMLIWSSMPTLERGWKWATGRVS